MNKLFVEMDLAGWMKWLWIALMCGYGR